MSRPDSYIDRLLANVVERGGCWVVGSGLLSTGYGQIWDGDARRNRLAHRVMWEHVVGVIPAGRQLDHLCRNRACCNPAHLEVVTCRTNIVRGESPAAVNARKTRCPRGHELTPENLTPSERRRGRRACLVCKREQARRRMARRRA